MGKDLKGKELGEGLTQRKDGTYQARYTDMFGKRQTMYSKNLRLLRKDLAVKISENENGIAIRDKYTLDEWHKRWMMVYKKDLKANTIIQYNGIYNRHISPYLGNKPINTIVKSDIQMLIEHAEDEGFKYEVQSKIRSIMGDMMNRAIEDLLIVRNPVVGIKLYSEREQNAKALSAREQSVFFDYCKGSFYENLFVVAVNTGMRPGELFALTEKDLDFEKGYINVTKTLNYMKGNGDNKKNYHIGTPKTKNSIRKVPMNSVCREYLHKQVDLKQNLQVVKNTDTPFLFVTTLNTPLCAWSYRNAINSIVEKINEKRELDSQFELFSGHVFRHTFATRCLENGVQPKVIQAYLGHASLKMTMDLYIHVTDERSQEEIERIVPVYKDNIVFLGQNAV